MKLFTVALSALLAGFVSAQSFSALPQCAQNCTINAIPSSCKLNPKCICEDAGFIKAITCCVAQVCDAADQETTIKYADSICVPAGVTNLPTAATCANTANSTGTATASSTTGSAVLSNSLTSSASSAASSVEASVSSAASSAVASVSSAASAAATATGTAQRNYMAQGMGVMGAAALAAAALM